MVAQVIPFAPKNPTDFGRTTAYFLAIDLVYQVKVYGYCKNDVLPVCWWGEYFRILDDLRNEAEYAAPMFGQAAGNVLSGS